MVSRQHRGARKRGAGGERAAIPLLQRMGMSCILPVKTGVTVIKATRRDGGIITGQFFYDEKVAGDFICLDSDGTGVLVEVKTVDTLSVTCFKPHQLKKLQEWSYRRGTALVVWVTSHGVFAIDPNDIQKGHPIHSVDARKHCIAHRWL